ncbi:unnamed protein product [Colias eurytheme]|nr:unnamed protein product [Colias eurytheme]
MFYLIVLSLLASVLSAREPKQINIANQGTIAGMYITRFRTKRIAAYLGIPYAQPPLEFRRFSPPEYTDLPQWEGVRNATLFAPDCMQSDPKKEDVQNPLSRHDELFTKLLESQMEEPRKKEYSEDCLYLNVYVPDDVKVEGYPTMVWFHGGNFVRGSPNYINPFHLVLKQKVIFVSVAYRLNIFGFFSTLDNEAPGNFGLLDQVAALTWVKNNIESFGGDPENVCIFGHDAGAVSVGLHLISSYSSGLFQKAIAMSGNVLSPDTVNIARKEVITVDKVANAFSCFRKPTYQLLDCLRRVNYQALLDIGEPLAEWKPLVDNGFSNISLPFLTDLPSKMFKDEIFSPVPILTGFTNMEDALLLDKDGNEDSGLTQREFDVMREEVILSDITVDNSSCFTNQHHIQEAVAFFYKPIPPTKNETILRKLFLEFYTDKVYGATTYQLAKYMNKHSPVYLYRFDLKPFSDVANDGIPDWVAVPHNFDLIFTFGLPHLAQPEDLTKWDYRDKSISEIVMKMWSNFAWYSNPTNSGVIIQWDPFEEEKPGFFIIDRQNFTMSTAQTIEMFTWKIVCLLVTVNLVAGQRPTFAGFRPIGFPELQNKTSEDGLGNRFGDDGTPLPLPIEAKGDVELIKRISKLPVDKQPFWYINWKALEESRRNPQTYDQRPNPFIPSDTSSNVNGPLNNASNVNIPSNNPSNVNVNIQPNNASNDLTSKFGTVNDTQPKPEQAKPVQTQQTGSYKQYRYRSYRGY